jgi:muramoyltetrapeptide carboxypeptidase
MTLLIDPPQSPGHGRLWAHLSSDASFSELHEFAAALGIPSRGFDRDHYDVPADRYESVVAAGATPVSSRDLIGRLHEAGLRRRQGERLMPRAAGARLARAPRLRPGDAVAVTSPSGPVPAAELDAGVAILESWGLGVRLMPQVRAQHEQLSYLAGDDAVRAGDLVRAWCDPSVRAVFCARGGYGAQRILDLVDWEALTSAGPKVLVGFSDVTALHQAFASRLGLSTIHGPVVTSLGTGTDAAREQLRSLLFERSALTPLTPSPAPALAPGRAEGPLAGGNLALLAAEVGTPDSRSGADSIAVLEDVDEDLYRLDRLLTQLLRSGWFERVRAIALGQFTGCGSPDSLRHLFTERLGHLGVPTLWDLRIGHMADNLGFPLGVPALLDADAGTLTLLESALV